MMNEIWKDISGYEGYYQVSNLGRVKSLPRLVKNKYSQFYTKEKILNSWYSKGYKQVSLCVENKRKTMQVHQLVFHTFISKPEDNYVVDHINNIRDDNRLVNLQKISNRENTSKDKKNKTSKYTGVSWNKKTNKWVATIKIKSQKNQCLYYGDNEYDAHLAYQKKLKEISE